MELKKGISFFGVFSIATGAMISSGIFILPGLAFAKAGPALFISYFIAGLLGLLGILSVIELSTAMPKAGGDYYFINKTFGPLLGTVSGFLGWFALSLKSAFAIFGITEIIYLFTGTSPVISGLILVLAFVAINTIGVQEAATFQVILVALLLGLMVIFIFLGGRGVDTTNYSPFFKAGINEIIATAGFVFISFGGLLKVANVSEEVINPKRNIPLGIIVSVAVVTVLYTLITFVLVGTLDPEKFRTSLTPVADAARALAGTPGYIMIIVASLFAFFTTANAGIMSASRYPMALSRDELLPAGMDYVSERFKTPVYSILFTGILIGLSLFLPLEMLVKAASTVILTSYVLTNIAVVIFRESRLTNYQPSFMTPLYPWLQIASIILFSFFIFDLGVDAIELSLGFLAVSLCVFLLYGRKKKNRESALLHLLSRIVDSQLKDKNLEDELREVLISRDEIEQDAFDQLIKAAPVYDIKDKIDFATLLERIGDDMAEISGMSKKELTSLYLNREEEESTVMTDFLAIPHIVVDKEDTMFLVLVRSLEGIYFHDDGAEINALFILGGSAEKRHLHLKTLASIATLVDHKDFQKKWMEAHNSTEIKNLMVLNCRKRFQ